MRYVWHGLWFLPGLAAVALIWGVSAIVNWRFGLSLGTDSPFHFFTLFQISTAEVYSSASFAIDVLKTCAPFALVAAVQAKMHRASGVLLIALVLAIVWSLSSALGFAALNYSATTDMRGKDVIAWDKLTGEITRLEQRRDWTPEARPLAAVRAERAGMEAHILFGQTKQCADATLPDSIRHCDRWRALKVEEGNAAELVRIDEKLGKLRLEMEDKPKMSSESPRDEMFSHASGYGEKTIAVGYGVFFAFMIEAVASLGFWAICAAYGAAVRKPVAAGNEKVIPMQIRPIRDQASTVENKSIEPLEITAKDDEAASSAVSDPEPVPVPDIVPEPAKPEKKVHKLKLAVVPKRLTGTKEVDRITALWVEERMVLVDVDRDGGAANVLHENYDEFCKTLPEPVEGVNVSQLGKSVRRLRIATKRAGEAAQWGLRPKVTGGASRAAMMARAASG